MNDQPDEQAPEGPPEAEPETPDDSGSEEPTETSAAVESTPRPPALPAFNLDPAIRRALADIKKNYSRQLAAIPRLDFTTRNLLANLNTTQPLPQLPRVDNAVSRALSQHLKSLTSQWQSEVFRLNLPDFKPLFADLGKVIASIDWDAIQAQWFCPNWDPERGITQYDDFLHLALTEALPLTWVPNQDVTYQLLDADPDHRHEVLTDSTESILNDCQDQLSTFTTVPYLVDTTREAIAAHNAGFLRSAQALAASVFDTLLRRIIPPQPSRYYAKVKKALPTEDNWDQLTLRQIRTVPTAFAMTTVLANFDGHANVPSLLNRHATAHAVDPTQYTPANALKSLMLVTAMLSEVEFGGWDALIPPQAG